MLARCLPGDSHGQHVLQLLPNWRPTNETNITNDTIFLYSPETLLLSGWEHAGTVFQARQSGQPRRPGDDKPPQGPLHDLELDVRSVAWCDHQRDHCRRTLDAKRAVAMLAPPPKSLQAASTGGIGSMTGLMTGLMTWAATQQITCGTCERMLQGQKPDKPASRRFIGQNAALCTYRRNDGLRRSILGRS